MAGSCDPGITPQGGLGDAYIMKADVAAVVAKLLAPGSQPAGQPGWSVATDGNVAWVGALGENVIVNGQLVVGAGRVFIYNAMSGQLMKVIESPNPKAQGQFGAAVAVTDGVHGVVGAPREGVGGQGAAYIY